ncbi:MAG TPA: ATP-dependent RNA helicase HrpA, partial [Crenotrichaceae bacterium]|nr:ATP-dependent RNA helicase HrpA [Crenotrichaceae bacterium]
MITANQVHSIKDRINSCLRKDQYRLRADLKRFEAVCIQAGQVADQSLLAKITQRIDKSVALCEQRIQSIPSITYPDLPVSGKVTEITNAIQQNQVVIISGETGSGKTTQLPKICLAAGCGKSGFIGHTQPRRLAARTVAQRIADELGSKLGDLVGYKVRFHEQVRPYSLIKVMTDGILLAETRSDRFLEQYDTLIIDEAHERSLNVDFLLGYLKWLLPRRPDLKVIVTSATLDTDEFSTHFDGAPVIEVGGRSYPIETRYRTIADKQDKDSVSPEYRALLDAIAEIREQERGDILVFFSGEREIREAAEVLRKHGDHHDEVLPLYSRLNVKEQQRVFASHRQSRIILATNVAETSLTVPGVRAVIDFGKARISRYSFRTKLQRLPIEPISQASANQRAGRCGRLGPGICIRLYSEEDFNDRPAFTEPEILRTNLAAVILQMTMLRLGDIQSFPFLAAPDHKMIRDGIKTLIELNAFNEHERITNLGKQLAQLPIDPRLGRMLLAAKSENCLTELCVIAAGLSVQDPRERPVDQTRAADEKHAEYVVDDSDFLSLLKLWQCFEYNKKHLSNRKLRQYCREHFLSYRRLLEWEDIHHQLLQIIKGQMGLTLNQDAASFDAIHRAILPGLLLFVGMREEAADYLGLRNKKFHIHPGSGLFQSKPKWVVSAEQVETSKLYARTVAKIKPAWIEHSARHLSKRELFDAHWSRKAKRVFVYERIILSGLVLVPRRKIPYDSVDKNAAREIFIRSALVQMDLSSQAGFFVHNRKLVESVQYLQHKRRRPDLLVSDEQRFEWFNARLPKKIWDGYTLDKWLKQADANQVDALKLDIKDVLDVEQSERINCQYPDEIHVGSYSYQLKYRLEPGHQEDGVTAIIPLHLLSQVDPVAFQWLVPGLLRDKICGLIRSLPKSLRKYFVPVPDYADRCLQQLDVGNGSLHQQLTTVLKQSANLHLHTDMLDENALDDHLRMNFIIIDQGKTIACSRNLQALQAQLMKDAGRAFTTIAEKALKSTVSKDWVFGEIPLKHLSHAKTNKVTGYPALSRHAEGVTVVLYETEQLARYHHR